MLPNELLKIIVESYYTPVINAYEEYNNFHSNFYFELIYPSHSTKIRVPLPNYTYKKSCFKHFDTDGIESFINCLYTGEDYELRLVYPFDVCISIKNNKICFNYEDVHIEVNKTETFRNELVKAMGKYLDFVNSYYDD